MKNNVIDLFGNKNIVPNTGVKYSTLLEKFIAQFQNEFLDVEYFEDIIDFAINAWNMANINIIMPNEDFEKAMGSIEQEEEESISLLKKMMEHKEEKYKVFTNFIVDFELKETSGNPILSVITQEEETYLSNMMNTLDNEVTHNDFEENYINRIAIIIKPLQPFIDWHNNLYPDSTINETDIDINLYLVNDQIDDLEKFLKKKFDKFFMLELENWHTNKKEWPQRRNYKMFKLWFRVETSEIVYDLEKKPVLKSE